jgi:hypothetical protein
MVSRLSSDSPLDVGVFQPYKHWHAEAIDDATRTGCTSFNKVEFLAAIESIRAKTFTKRTIRRGWQETGLIPYKPDVVLDKLRRDEFQHALQRPATPSTPPLLSSSPRLMETPHTIRTLKKNVDFLLEDPDLPDHVRKTLFGGLTQATIGDQATEELTALKTADQKRRARQARTRRVLKSDMGVMYSHKAREMVKKRQDLEIQEEMRKNQKRTKALERQERARAKAWEPIFNELARLHDSMRKGGCFQYENDYD